MRLGRHVGNDCDIPALACADGMTVDYDDCEVALGAGVHLVLRDCECADGELRLDQVRDRQRCVERTGVDDLTRA